MFDIKIIETGYILADGGAMFGAIPKRAWQRKYGCDENNLCTLTMRCVLAVAEDKRIIIDTGLGAKQLDEIGYYQPHGLINIDNALADFGYSANDITDVVLTHLHFDHCGGGTYMDDSGQIVPTFPNANYWLSQKQWDSFLNPCRLEKDSFFDNNIRPIYEAEQLRLIHRDTSLCYGLDLRLFDGHTSGQIVAYIDTHEGKHVFVGDLIPTSAHVPLEWISAYDLCALTSASEKERFLSEAEKETYTLIYCHDVKVKKSKVKKLNESYKAVILKNEF